LSIDYPNRKAGESIGKVKRRSPQDINKKSYIPGQTVKAAVKKKRNTKTKRKTLDTPKSKK
jgi:hypothetical protein